MKQDKIDQSLIIIGHLNNANLCQLRLALSYPADVEYELKMFYKIEIQTN